MNEVVALFPNRETAEGALDALKDNGYTGSNWGYLDRYRDESGAVITDADFTPDVESIDEDGVADDAGDTAEEAGKGIVGGMIGGAATGAGATLLAAAGLLAVPGVGPFLAAGTLAGAVGAATVGAAGGAALGGAAGAIYGATHDADDDVAVHYRDQVDSGRSMLTVHVDDADSAAVADILRSHGAERVDFYGDSRWVTN